MKTVEEILKKIEVMKEGLETRKNNITKNMVIVSSNGETTSFEYDPIIEKVSNQIEALEWVLK